jgi:hypothetical protein
VWTYVTPRPKPRGLLGDAVPNEVRDALACVRHDGVGDFLKELKSKV